LTVADGKPADIGTVDNDFAGFDSLADLEHVETQGQALVPHVEGFAKGEFWRMQRPQRQHMAAIFCSYANRNNRIFHV
jgi:hypothetical protein